MYHCMGLIVVVANALAQGATVVTMMRFGFEPFLQAMQDHRVTATVVAPPIARASPATRRRRLRPVGAALGRLRRGAARRRDRGELRARLRCLFGQGYGMSEATAAIAVVLNAEPERIVRGSVGELLPGIEARMVDPETGADLGADAEGELLSAARSSCAATGAARRDGRDHRRRRVAPHRRPRRRHAEGLVRITDRLKELIKVKGLQVAPAELEGVLCSHPAVADAAVVGVPDEAAGERPEGVRRGARRGEARRGDDLGRRARRAAQADLCAVEVVDEIPKLPSGKILRRVLRDA